MHSGSFLEELTGFRKETMRGKIRTYYTERKGNNRTDTGQIVRCTSFVFALFICSVLCGCTRREQLVLETGDAPQEAQYEALDVSGSDDGTEQKDEQDQIPSVVYVHVCGAVKNPGVYELPAGSRVYEAVEEAGGFTEDADSSYVNQAQKLTDGVKLIIPTMEQTEAASESDAAETIGVVGAAATEQDDRININTASEAELCNIPGIGETRAAAIVAYRQEKGGFASIEDIMNVNGIKEGTYDKIKDRIKVD